MKKIKFIELEKIDQLCSKMTEKLEKVESEIEKRQDYYENKSESWQDSEKGKEYEDFTDNLSYCKEMAEEHIQTILDAVEELKDMQDD